MADRTIAVNRLAELVAAVGKDFAVYGPSADSGVVAFRKIKSAHELALDCRTTTVSAKELFLPKTETVYEFDGEQYVDNGLPSEKRVVFGMRPCDCRALKLLDVIFDTQEIRDPFYAARRANAVVIAMGCDNPLSTCFCTAVGGDPFGEDGADVLLARSGDSFAAKPVSPKGNDFLSRYKKFFSGSGSADWEQQKKQAHDKIRCELKIDAAKSRLGGLFDDGIWRTISQKCLGCGACSYLCPVCYCFDLTDEKKGKGVKKIRRWDCCMFPLFTRHASGHNPRPANAARLRQKVMHKFSYYPDRYGVSGCVGCGRCVRSCPVNLDIRQVLTEVADTGAGK